MHNTHDMRFTLHVALHHMMHIQNYDMPQEVEYLRCCGAMSLARHRCGPTLLTVYCYSFDPLLPCPIKHGGQVTTSTMNHIDYQLLSIFKPIMEYWSHDQH